MVSGVLLFYGVLGGCLGGLEFGFIGRFLQLMLLGLGVEFGVVGCSGEEVFEDFVLGDCSGMGL